MPPKSEAPKKAAPAVLRPEISNASLFYVPNDAVEGYEERIETGIDWTILEDGARHHKELCKREDIPIVKFSEALENKIKKSIIDGFVDKESGLSLDQHWEFLLPAIMWDNERFASEEGKVCFHNANCVTDDLVTMIKKTVKAGDRDVLKKEMKMVHILRVNDSQMTELDKGLTQYKKLITLNLCGNFLNTIQTKFLPPSLRSLELQANRISDVSGFAESLPSELLYLGLARNFLTSEKLEGLSRLPYNLTVLDLSDNDIYHLDRVLDAVDKLPNLTSLQLSGNPCSVSAGYARCVLLRLDRLRWLDCREILPTDRPSDLDAVDTHPDELRSTYFHFTVFRVISAPQPPKPEKGTLTSFYVELEIPLLDVVRRTFLLFRRNESLITVLPPPEDFDWSIPAQSQNITKSKFFQATEMVEASSHSSDIYAHMEPKNPLEIHHFTTFESTRTQWNKMMNFQEPAVKIFCPDLVALRNTFRSVITVRLVYSVITTMTAKDGKKDRKSFHVARAPTEMKVTLATIKCALKPPDWSQPSQHFHWDDSLATNEAIHWGDGDLSVIQYSLAPVKVIKGKQEGADIGSRQMMPDNLTCHFGFGIDTLRTS